MDTVPGDVIAQARILNAFMFYQSLENLRNRSAACKMLFGKDCLSFQVTDANTTESRQLVIMRVLPAGLTEYRCAEIPIMREIHLFDLYKFLSRSCRHGDELEFVVTDEAYVLATLYHRQDGTEAKPKQGRTPATKRQPYRKHKIAAKMKPHSTAKRQKRAPNSSKSTKTDLDFRFARAEEAKFIDMVRQLYQSSASSAVGLPLSVDSISEIDMLDDDVYGPDGPGVDEVEMEEDKTNGSVSCRVPSRLECTREFPDLDFEQSRKNADLAFTLDPEEFQTWCKESCIWSMGRGLRIKCSRDRVLTIQWKSAANGNDSFTLDESLVQHHHARGKKLPLQILICPVGYFNTQFSSRILNFYINSFTLCNPDAFTIHAIQDQWLLLHLPMQFGIELEIAIAALPSNV